MMALYFYAEVYANTGRWKEEDLTATKKALRQAAGQFSVTSAAIPYRLWGHKKIAGEHEKVREIVGLLTGISNNLLRSRPEDQIAANVENSQHADKIFQLLDWPKLTK